MVVRQIYKYQTLLLKTGLPTAAAAPDRQSAVANRSVLPGVCAYDVATIAGKRTLRHQINPLV